MAVVADVVLIVMLLLLHKHLKSFGVRLCKLISLLLLLLLVQLLFLLHL